MAPLQAQSNYSENKMTKGIKLAVGAGVAAMIALAPSAASALPVVAKGAISSATAGVEQVGLICDDWGRCWRTAPSYYGGGWGPGPYYGGGWRPRPSYYYGRGYYGGGWGPQPYQGWNGGGWRGEGWHGHHEDHDD